MELVSQKDATKKQMGETMSKEESGMGDGRGCGSCKQSFGRNGGRKRGVY